MFKEKLFTGTGVSVSYRQANSSSLLEAYVKLHFPGMSVLCVYTNDASPGEMKVLEELFNDNEKFQSGFDYLFLPVGDVEEAIQTINNLEITVPIYLYDETGKAIHENR